MPGKIFYPPSFWFKVPFGFHHKVRIIFSFFLSSGVLFRLRVEPYARLSGRGSWPELISELVNFLFEFLNNVIQHKNHVLILARIA